MTSRSLHPSCGFFFRKENDDPSAPPSFCGLVTSRGEELRAEHLVASCGELLQDEVPGGDGSRWTGFSLFLFGALKCFVFNFPRPLLGKTRVSPLT